MVERSNRMPAERYRHAVVCLARANPAFTARISKPGVAVHVLGKQPGLSRLDVGPRVTMRVGHGIRASADYRVKVAGNAQPGSGGVITLAGDF